MAKTESPTGTTRLFRGGAFVADHWRSVDGDESVPHDGAVIVPLARWRSEPALRDRAAPTGVRVTPPDMIGGGDDVGRASLIIVTLAKFTDGRAYSQARRLRETLGYTGELRATGDVLGDQLPLLARCGFDSFEIADAATIRGLERGVWAGLSHVYQPPGGSRRVHMGAAERMRRRA
jgi:phosphoadenosine phosphosulfate reductase